MKWNRKTKWRQGSMIPVKGCHLLSNCPSESIAMSISHDCDIANDNLDAEPHVEFVIGKISDRSDGNSKFAKNPRILDLEITYKGNPAVLRVLAHQKHVISKELLVKFEPDENYNLNEVHILQSWLSARYRRQTLPDNLVDRLGPIFDFLEKNGKKHASGIITIFFDYEPKNEVLTEQEPYELWMYITYLVDNEIAAEDAHKIAKSLIENFETLIDKSKAFGPVLLQKCKAYSEREFTLYDLRRHIEYRLEHLSNRLVPPGPITR